MRLVDSDIKKFKALYVQHFDQVLNDDEAREQLALLVRQVEIVYQPITVSQFDNYLMKYVNEADDNETPKIRTTSR
jgi:hypothetical protein